MSNASVGSGRDHTNEIRRLATLLEVSQALSGVLNLKAALQSVLDILERRHQVAGGAVLLVDRDSKDCTSRRRAASGCPASAAADRGDGSGITERVIDSGQAGRRAARQPGAEPGAAGRRARARRPRADLHRRADRPSGGGRRARSRSCCPSSPIATTSARSSSTASSPR